MKHSLALMLISASLGLAACAPKVETVAMPVIDGNLPGVQACKTAIVKTAKVPAESVVLTQTAPVPDGTHVTATISGYKGSWSCFGTAKGKVSGVAYKA